MGRVYLAEHSEDGRQVALKVLNDDIVRERTARVRFLREAQSAAAVMHASVAAVYAIHEVEDAVFIAMEYVEGVTLRAFLDARRGPLELREALRIARDVAHALCHAHAAGVVHRDLKPENLMLDQRGQVKILDFGLAKHGGAAQDGDVERASTLSFATADGIILGTPSYMAPEQIHGKPTDARADIFSVGVVLYEMAAGARPFRGASTMEVLIATARDELDPASTHNPQVTPELDALLARCLAKSPDDRFASADELAAMLDELLLSEVEVELQGAVPGNARGYLGEILPPRFLRGRELATAALLGATERAREGGAHLMLVHGDAGVGKSALLSSVRDPVGRGGGRFVSGKFDRDAQGAPLAPLAQALGALVRQIAGSPDAERWRIDLADATGPNRHVLDDMVPELRRLLGPAPDAPADAAEAQNRFHAAFQRIVRLFAARTPPLVLALDDLHCADPAALHLIELILSDPAGGNLLVIASYRDAELDDAHPLRLTQDRLRRLGVAVSELELRPLTRDEVTQLVADALGCSNDEAALLASRLDGQAGGNPAMLRHLLLGLRREGQLTFDSQSGRWRWDETSPMTSAGSAVNVAAFLAARLQRLPAGVQRVLAIAALAGRPLDLPLLSAVDRRGPLETTADLREALREGLLVPSDSALHTLQESPATTGSGTARATYQPLHDGITQAAALLLPPDERAEIHLQLGRSLLRQPNLGDDDLFALVDHLDRGMSRMTDPAERERLARLHL
ncbi:MAG: protein kinase, partial [Nannocystis sp.]